MDVEKMLNEIDSWFDSDEGQKAIKEMVEKLEAGEREKERLEKASTLRYADGRKVKIGDLFIDKEAKERFDADPASQYYGYHRYVNRINEDETVDLYIDANVAWMLSEMSFDPDNSELVERKVRLYSPFDDMGDEE